MRTLFAALVAAVLVVGAGPAPGQTEHRVADLAAAAESLDIPKMLAVTGGAVLGVVFFNMLSGNVLAARLLEDLGRGVAVVGAAVLGGAGGHYAFTHWGDMTAIHQ